MESKENEPQINADERGFVASNPSLLIGSWDLVLLFSDYLMCGCFGNVSARGGILFWCYYFSKTIALNLRLSAFICG